METLNTDGDCVNSKVLETGLVKEKQLKYHSNHTCYYTNFYQHRHVLLELIYFQASIDVLHYLRNGRKAPPSFSILEKSVKQKNMHTLAVYSKKFEYEGIYVLLRVFFIKTFLDSLFLLFTSTRVNAIGEKCSGCVPRATI